MAKSRNQKSKILIIEHMLLQSGENKVVTMQQILTELENHGIQAERKSVYDDMDALRDFGLNVRFCRGRSGGYYIENNTPVEMPEQTGKPESEKEEEPVLRAAQPAGVSYESPAAVPAPGSKPLRLLVKPEAMEEISKFFIFGYEIKEQTEESALVIVSQELNPQFYGWLTAMGENVYLVKPRKAVAAYRDYLKALARGYKSLFE